MEAATKAKDVQKSVRLSQEVYEYVESADGKSFNDKLNCLIMDAKRSEADLLERIQRYDERIEQEEAELLRCMKHKEDFMDMQRKAVHILRQLEELEGEVKKQIEERRNDKSNMDIQTHKS